MADSSKKPSTEARRVRASKPFREARSRAESYMNDQARLSHLVQEASDKAVKSGKPLAEIWDSLTAAFRLIKAYAKGSYRQVPWSSVVMIVAALLYFVMPADLVPDFLFGLGLVDDAALLAWTLKTLNEDIAQFKAWEEASSEPLNDT